MLHSAGGGRDAHAHMSQIMRAVLHTLVIGGVSNWTACKCVHAPVKRTGFENGDLAHVALQLMEKKIWFDIHVGVAGLTLLGCNDVRHVGLHCCGPRAIITMLTISCQLPVNMWS